MFDIASRLPRPPTKAQRQANPGENPFKLVASLTLMQHLLFFSAFIAWMLDAYDFFSVSLSIVRLNKVFGTTTEKLTLAITLTLLFRSLGACIFGLFSDRFGRKWPLVINLIIIAALELGSSFVNTYSQFLAVRSLFGIGMGGIWGLAASNGLENLPVAARGLYSGLLQEGYAIGYLLAAVVNLTVVEDKNNWRPLFQIGAGLSLFAAIVRAVLPESQYFIDQKVKSVNVSNKTRVFFREIGHALRTNWVRCIYAFLLMTGFNFFSHASQDIYPTYLQNGKGLSSKLASKATIISNCGAVAGGVIAGWASQFLGRRLTIIVCCIWSLCFIPLWTIPESFGGLAAGAFMMQMGVQGAWGVIPVYLQELSPPAFRAVWPGVAYQLGNMASSGSSQIEATGGEQLRTTFKGKDVPDYAKVLQIFLSVVAVYIIILALFGDEAHSAEFEKTDAAFIENAGNVHTDAAHVGGVHDTEKGEKGLHHQRETTKGDHVDYENGSTGSDDGHLAAGNGTAPHGSEKPTIA